MSHTVPLATYLFTRLRQLGIESIHGVPGDYNLRLLDYVEPDLHWVGNCNELNAGYAADAYSRIKGVGALITTFGVGELSAANAIAGAYAELAPVIHIVGTPDRRLQDSGALIHHTLNDGNFRRFAQMHVHITVAQASLRDPRTCPAMIDETILQCLIHSRPVYIEVPSDMVSLPVASERLQSKIELPVTVTPKDEASALAFVLNRIYTSKRPMILVDGECRAYDIIEELHTLIKLTNWSTWTSVFGKGLIDESIPNVHGIWRGSWADQEEKDFVNSCDLILCFGPHFSTTNTYALSSIPDPKISILFTASEIKSQNQTFRDLLAKYFLSKLLEELNPSKLLSSLAYTPQSNHSVVNGLLESSNPITQDKFYSTLSDSFRSGDIILAETGTAGHGSRDFKLPPHTHLFKPSTWLSIGYMLPAAQGAALAQRELHTQGKWPQSQDNKTGPRTILLIGDGSFQMTVQELSTIVREKLDVLVILIENNGYTIERCLHGWNRRYNDIAPWRYLHAPTFFGEGDGKEAESSARTRRVETWRELGRVLADERIMDGQGLRMVEVGMDQEDAPKLLRALLEQQKASAVDADAK